MSRTITVSGRAARKKARKRSAVSENSTPEICACCGKAGVVGREVGPLASGDWVHHACWPAFHFDGVRHGSYQGGLF